MTLLPDSTTGKCTKCRKPVPHCPLCFVETIAEDVIASYGKVLGATILAKIREIVKKKSK